MIFGARLNYTNSPEFKAQDSAAIKKAFPAFSRAGMEACFQALAVKPYMVDKSRGWGVHYDLLEMIFGEEPKFICMVRYLRQTHASVKRSSGRIPTSLSGILGMGTFH